MDTPTPTTTVRLPRPLIEEIRAVAKAHDRSLSAELRVALAAYAAENLPKTETAS